MADGKHWAAPRNDTEARAIEAVLYFAAVHTAQWGSCLDMEVVFHLYILPRLKYLSDLTLTQMLEEMQDEKIHFCIVPDEADLERAEIEFIRGKIRSEMDCRKGGETEGGG